VHLVGFIIIIYHNARSPEHKKQNQQSVFFTIMVTRASSHNKNSAFMLWTKLANSEQSQESRWILNYKMHLKIHTHLTTVSHTAFEADMPLKLQSTFTIFTPREVLVNLRHTGTQQSMLSQFVHSFCSTSVPVLWRMCTYCICALSGYTQTVYELALLQHNTVIKAFLHKLGMV
jgi:hypothetical protein